MEKKKPIGSYSGRLFCFFSVAAFLFAFSQYFTRELWFDEVLTLQFASLPSLTEIYHSYIIPNNQIVHTWFIHAILNTGTPVELLRLFPFLCGAAVIFILWKNFSREKGSFPLAAALAALALSPPFLLYASAIRGYMPAALFSVCALCYARKYALGSRLRHLAMWFIFSLLTVGVMPSALAGLAAAGLYVLPYCGKKFWKNRKIYLLALAPVLAFIIFYGPIHRDLQNAFALKEGWHAPWGALLATATAIAVTFAIPLIAALFFHRPAMRYFPRTVIWFLPLGGLLLPVSPFPRVWFVLFPFFALLIAGYLRKVPVKYHRSVLYSVILWGVLTTLEPSRIILSPAVSCGGQDDFYAPVFARSRFKPSETALFLKNFPGRPVFVSFDADPYSILYYKADIMMDVPYNKYKILPDNALVVLGTSENPNGYSARFNGSLQTLHTTSTHTVYHFNRRSL